MRCFILAKKVGCPSQEMMVYEADLRPGPTLKKR
jgi:hypothetical protein